MMKGFLASIGRLGLYLAWIGFFVLVPTSFFESHRSVCLFRNILGRECPGCGMTRAVSSLLHGDLAGALQYNRLIVVVFPLLCYILMRAVARERKQICLLKGLLPLRFGRRR